MNVTGRRLVPALVAILALTACKSDSDKAADAAADSAGVATQPAANTGPTAERTADRHGDAGRERGGQRGRPPGAGPLGNPDVRNFGQTMVTDHTEHEPRGDRPDHAAAGDARGHRHEPAAEGVARPRGRGARTKTGADFDRAYIQHEVTMHGNLLPALDQQMIPGAQNPELKALLQKVRPAVQAHLERAQADSAAPECSGGRSATLGRVAPAPAAAPPTTTNGGT